MEQACHVCPVHLRCQQIATQQLYDMPVALPPSVLYRVHVMANIRAN